MSTEASSGDISALVGIASSEETDGGQPSTSQHRQDAPAFDRSQGIANPSPIDVICGRGKMTVAHPGNRKFRDLVLTKKRAYQLARRRDDKTKITFELVQKLRQGGRCVYELCYSSILSACSLTSTPSTASFFFLTQRAIYGTTLATSTRGRK